MADQPKLVVRFNQWYNPVMEERFQREPDLELATVDRDGPDEGVWGTLGRAHAIQVSSAKDELPRRWFVTRELLARCPGLLVRLLQRRATTPSTFPPAPRRGSWSSTRRAETPNPSRSTQSASCST